MRIPPLKIGNLTARLPIVQGGMGVGISLSKLAAAVAKAGGIGVIAGAEIGFNFPEYQKNKLQANLQAIRHHIRQARELAPHGILGINLMVAINHYELMVKTALEEGIDIIFSGAGLPLNLPKLTSHSNTKIVPIISSGRGAAVICRQWDRKFNYLPDAIVIEGPLAGGHLGFDYQELTSEELPSLDNLVLQVKQAIQPYEEKYDRNVPLIVGGGIITGEEIGHLLDHGAQGVQIATLFAATEECDASPAWKNELIRATKDDVMIIQSPVGMPGRAIRNPFLEEMTEGKRRPIRCSINCLRPCKPQEAPYCIAEALINAQQGNLNEGFAFSGANVDQIHEILPVQKVIDRLVDGIRAYQEERELILTGSSNHCSDI